MQGNRLVIPFHVTGTLAANVTFTWTAPFDCTLEHISAVASNDSDATLIVGMSDDADEILAATTIGDSGTPSEFDVDNWASTNPTAKILNGDVVVVTVDYDGSSGTAAQDLTVVLTLRE